MGKINHEEEAPIVGDADEADPAALLLEAEAAAAVPVAGPPMTADDDSEPEEEALLPKAAEANRPESVVDRFVMFMWL